MKTIHMESSLRVTHADVANVVCPACCAESGESCLGGPSGSALVHVERMVRAVKEATEVRAEKGDK